MAGLLSSLDRHRRVQQWAVGLLVVACSLVVMLLLTQTSSFER